MYSELLGPVHPHTLVCVNNLAAAALAAGDHGTGRDLARSAVADLSEVLGRDHPYCLAAQTNLSVGEAAIGDLAAAVTVAEDAARRAGRILGSDHPDALRCAANLALIRARLPGRRATSEERPLWEPLAARIGADHPDVRALTVGRPLTRVIDPHPF